MEIVRAGINDAKVVGLVHSTAWKQAYENVFPPEYLYSDTPAKRTQEFLESCNNKDVFYYLLYEAELAVGVVKVMKESDGYEIVSFYILEEHRGKGFGKQAVIYLSKLLGGEKVQLWVLEDNKKARRFYENNGFKNTGNTRVICRGDSYVQMQYELNLPKLIKEHIEK